MKNTIKLLLSKSKFLLPFKNYQKNKIIIFNYHRIRDINKTILFDESVFGPDIIRFRQEMEWLKKETKILSENELVDIIYSDKKMSELSTVVTFDDGYRDNFDLAYPVLNELKIPAIFFIPTLSISERKVGWWDIVAYLIKESKLAEFKFRNMNYEITDPQKLIKIFTDEIKLIKTCEVENHILDLAESLNEKLPSTQIQTQELMTWDQIKFMSDNGMSIGTHSHDHSILSNQDGNVLKEQLEKSVLILENILNKKIISIAYPVGGYKHFNEDTKIIANEIGLKLGFSYLTGINTINKIDPYNIKRMNILPEWISLDLPLAFPNIFLRAQDQ